MRQDNADYAGMVENVDWNVGRLLSLLRELKMDKNTLIILSSDHGGLSNRGPGNRELATTNYPLRAGKGHLYEGGIRVPLLLHWKDKIVPGTDSTSIILGMDIFPTVLELTTGKQLPGIDGKSYKAVMAGQDSWDKRTVFWHKAKARPNSTGDTNSSVIRAGNLKLLHFYEEDRIELYDLSIDKSEEHNLAEDRADQAAVLLEELHIWKKSYLIPEKVNVKQMAKKNASKKN